MCNLVSLIPQIMYKNTYISKSTSNNDPHICSGIFLFFLGGGGREGRCQLHSDGFGRCSGRLNPNSLLRQELCDRHVRSNGYEWIFYVCIFLTFFFCPAPLICQQSPQYVKRSRQKSQSYPGLLKRGKLFCFLG